MVSKQSIVEWDMKFVDGGRYGKILCWWRLIFVPQLGLSVPMVWIWRLFSWIYWLHQIPTYMRMLEIAWWWRTGAVIMSSWHTWNILVKRAGSGGPSNSRCEIDTIRLMHTNSRILPCDCLPVICDFWLLMSFIGLLRMMGVNLLIAFFFNGAFITIAGGQPCWERTMTYRHAHPTKSILFAFVPLCMHIRSYFYIDDVHLFTLWSLVATIICSS